MQPSGYAPPRLIFWESTAGCNLTCIHCRRITLDYLGEEPFCSYEPRKARMQMEGMAL